MIQVLRLHGCERGVDVILVAVKAWKEALLLVLDVQRKGLGEVPLATMGCVDDFVLGEVVPPTELLRQARERADARVAFEQRGHQIVWLARAPIFANMPLPPCSYLGEHFTCATS